MTFLNPLDALIPNIPFQFFFCGISGPGHLRGPGVSLGRILGGPSIEPFFGGGLARGLYRHPPPQSAPPPHQLSPTPRVLISSVRALALTAFMAKTPFLTPGERDAERDLHRAGSDPPVCWRGAFTFRSARTDAGQSRRSMMRQVFDT